jgi:hypothetical protein
VHRINKISTTGNIQLVLNYYGVKNAIAYQLKMQLRNLDELRNSRLLP